jgi:hypothetical protein
VKFPCPAEQAAARAGEQSVGIGEFDIRSEPVAGFIRDGDARAAVSSAALSREYHFISFIRIIREFCPFSYNIAKF